MLGQREKKVSHSLGTRINYEVNAKDDREFKEGQRQNVKKSAQTQQHIPFKCYCSSKSYHVLDGYHLISILFISSEVYVWFCAVLRNEMK